MLWAAPLALLLAGIPALLPGASSQAWEISDYQGFAEGKFENISLHHEGLLTLAPRLRPVFESDQPLIWAMAAAPDGSVYLGTGHQGRVYKVDPQGTGKLFWQAPEIEVFALAVGPDGQVYAATSPNGKVYRLSAEGKGELFFDPKETYIWALAWGSDSNGQSGSGGSLFVGTGDAGKIYRVDAKGEGDLYFDSEQRHVISLALDREGRLLAGTDPNGILYRIEKKGKAFALYDANLPEIRALQVAPNGDIYAAAMGGGVSQAIESVPSATLSSSPGAGSTVTVTAALDDEIGPKAAPTESAARSSRPRPVVTVSQPVISYGGVEKAALLRVRPDLAVEKLWSSNEENLLALGFGDSDESRPLLATDHEGRIYRLESHQQVSLVGQTGQEQVTQLVKAGSALLVTTAHSGKLLRLEEGPSPTGTYQSTVKDTNRVSRWGRLAWRGETPAQASVEVSTRSGNSARPDATWSDWSEPIEAGEPEPNGERGGPITSPPARYFQWRAVLRGGAGAAPLIDRVRVTYLTQNAAPVIKSVEVSAARSTEASAGESGSDSSSAGNDSTASYSITVSDTGEVSTSGGDSEQQAISRGSRRMMTITWSAEDPDGDELSAAVSFRGEGESAWKVLEKDIKESKVSVDSDRLADGNYRFRVVVSDATVNPPDVARSAEHVSRPVLIDHTPPAVRLLSVDGRSAVRFEASDDVSILQSAEYSLDAGTWIPVYADDGIVDSRRETFTIRLTDLGPGEHLVTLRVRDRAGNAGLGKAVVR